MIDIEALVEDALGQVVPPSPPDPSLEERVREAVRASCRTVVALDDDPTGVQTVHDIAVLATWDQDALTQELRRGEPLFFVLTNSRALPGVDAAALNARIGRGLIDASAATGRPCAIVSRSDSTLRGHFPAESDALARELGGVDGVLLCPAFFEGGRVTAGDVHFVREGDRLVPAAETEFARDQTFGYRARTLPAWVEEKSGGRTRADAVASLSLEDIRSGGPERVASILRTARNSQPIVVNALDYSDLWTVVLGLLDVENAGKRFLYRTAASFVRARSGLPHRPLLSRDELLGAEANVPAVGVVVVGSHVQRTTEQLARLLTLPGVSGIEVSVSRLLGGEEPRAGEIARVTSQMNESLKAGGTVVVSTSRTVERPPGMAELDVARSVSDGLVEIVQGIAIRPDFVIGKGGITSSDVGTRGLGAERAMVLGQIRPGVPVWRLGAESRMPGLPYVVFPGNVGSVETMADIVSELAGVAQGDARMCVIA